MANLMRTSNPALNPKAFQGEGVAVGEAMTLKGTVNKTGFLLICVMATAIWTWNIFMESHNPASVMGLAAIGGIGGFIFALVTIFKKTWAPVTAPIYALLEGLVLGGVSAMFEMRYHGIAIQAVSLTFGTLVVLLLAYRSGLIPVTAEIQVGGRGCYGRDRAFLYRVHGAGIFRRAFRGDQWKRNAGDRVQRVCGGDCGVEPGAGF